MKIVASNLPEMIQKVSIAQKLNATGTEALNFEKINLNLNGDNMQATINIKNKGKLLEELRISQEFIKKIKKTNKNNVRRESERESLRWYYKISNKFFSNSCCLWASMFGE